MKIFLIRHGESTSDIRQKYEGDYDDHLTAVGREEAKVVAQKIRDKNVQVIFCSGKIRAKETCDIMRQILNCEMRVADDLNERDIYGAFTKLSKNQPEEEYRRLGELPMNKDAVIEGVETYEDFKSRVTGCFDEIVSNGYDAIAVVTHGGPIRCIFRELVKISELKIIGNGAIIELEKNGSEMRIATIDGAQLENLVEIDKLSSPL